MKIPTNPLIPPKPQGVKCPKCGFVGLKRSFKKEGKSTCSGCSQTVERIVIENPEGLKLIKCSAGDHYGLLHEGKSVYQWYSGVRKHTSCSVCGKTISTAEVSYTELQNFVEMNWDPIQEEDQEYYHNLLKNYPRKQ
jgi:hypothetical protein